MSLLDTSVKVIFFYLCPILMHYELKLSLWFNLSQMTKITEQEFARIYAGISEDRELICKHNPIGTQAEILLWMLLSCLISYLSLTEIETPCFNGMPNEETFKDAILFILKNRKVEDFDVEKYLSL